MNLVDAPREVRGLELGIQTQLQTLGKAKRFDVKAGQTGFWRKAAAGLPVARNANAMPSPVLATTFKFLEKYRMSTTAGHSVSLTYSEVLHKMQAKDWLQQPLANFTSDELEALSVSLPNLHGFNCSLLLSGNLGRNALAPVALVFALLWRHPSLANVRPASPELIEERHINEGLRLFQSYVESEMASRHLGAPNHTGYATLIEQLEKLLTSNI